MTDSSHVTGKPTASHHQRVTIADLAQHTGVSSATISRVLNGKSTVADDTRRVVLSALDELGYRRPAAAQPHAEALVGIVLPDLENPVYPLYLQSIETALSRQGFGSLLFCEQSFTNGEEEIISRLLDYGAAAAIFIDGRHGDVTSDKAPYQRLCNSGIRLVLVNGPSDQISAMSISVDNVLAMRSVVDHLTSLGHRRIGLATGPTRYTDALRKKQAFLAAMEDKGIAAGAITAASLASVEGGQAMALSLIDQDCTALVCANAPLSLGALLAAHGRGLSIPQDLSIVGFDDFADAPYLDPSLTSIRQPVNPMSMAAVSAIAEEPSSIGDNSSELLFQGSLIVRGSTASHRA